jgi:hypothetical protein
MNVADRLLGTKNVEWERACRSEGLGFAALFDGGSELDDSNSPSATESVPIRMR